MDIEHLGRLAADYGPFELSDGSDAGEQDLIWWGTNTGVDRSCVYLEDTLGYDPQAMEALIELANAVPELVNEILRLRRRLLVEKHEE